MSHSQLGSSPPPHKVVCLGLSQLSAVCSRLSTMSVCHRLGCLPVWPVWAICPGVWASSGFVWVAPSASTLGSIRLGYTCPLPVCCLLGCLGCLLSSWVNYCCLGSRSVRPSVCCLSAVSCPLPGLLWVRQFFTLICWVPSTGFTIACLPTFSFGLLHNWAGLSVVSLGLGWAQSGLAVQLGYLRLGTLGLGLGCLGCSGLGWLSVRCLSGFTPVCWAGSACPVWVHTTFWVIPPVCWVCPSAVCCPFIIYTYVGFTCPLISWAGLSAVCLLSAWVHTLLHLPAVHNWPVCLACCCLVNCCSVCSLGLLLLGLACYLLLFICLSAQSGSAGSGVRPRSVRSGLAVHNQSGCQSVWLSGSGSVVNGSLGWAGLGLSVCSANGPTVWAVWVAWLLTGLLGWVFVIRLSGSGSGPAGVWAWGWLGPSLGLAGLSVRLSVWAGSVCSLSGLLAIVCLSACLSVRSCLLSGFNLLSGLGCLLSACLLSVLLLLGCLAQSGVTTVWGCPSGLGWLLSAKAGCLAGLGLPVCCLGWVTTGFAWAGLSACLGCPVWLAKAVIGCPSLVNYNVVRPSVQLSNNNNWLLSASLQS